jgi:Relaxase/Mobilisation nuclease domain
MKWDEHQAVLVAHDDKDYKHVHVMLNVCHPETGLRLDDNFERRRAQAWALEYEREQGRIYCQQRLADPAAREKAPPRNIWEAFHESEKEFTRGENALRDNSAIFVGEPKNRENHEWQILKEIQRTERTAFFADGKIEYSELRKSIYREVREEFRGRWREYYAAEKDGADQDLLAALKAEITADQAAILGARRDEACAELRAARDQRYRGLLDDQRETRAELRWRQETGLDNAVFLSAFADRGDRDELASAFRVAADETLTPSSGRDDYAGTSSEATAREEAGAEARGPRDDSDINLNIVPSVGSIIDGLFSALINLGSGPTVVRRPAREEFEAAAQETLKHQEREREREEADAAERQKQRSFHGD